MTKIHRPVVQPYRNILNRSNRRLGQRLTLGLVMMLAAWIVTGVMLLFSVEVWGYLEAEIKTSVLLILLLLSLYWSFRTFKNTAQTVQGAAKSPLLRKLGEKGERILTAIELDEDPLQQDSRFIEAAILQNLSGIDPASFSDELRAVSKNHPAYRLFRRGMVYFLLVTSGLITTAAIHPEGLMRTTAFWKTYEKPNPFDFLVTPGTVTVEQGAFVEPTIEFLGSKLPDRVLLSYKTAVETEFRERPLKKIADSTYAGAPIELTNPIEYQILMDDFTSGLYRADVQIPPGFTALTAELTPPDYTGLEKSTVRYPFSDINFYRGSRVTFTARTNKPVPSITVFTLNRKRIIEPSDSLRSFFTFVEEPLQQDTLRFKMTGTDGIINPNPYRIQLNLLEDAAPTVVILEPSSDVTEHQPQELQIRYRASDDFGIARARLQWSLERLFENEPVQGGMRLDLPENGASALLSWNLEPLELRPRDVLTFWIQVQDNDAPAGGKWGESQKIQLIVPSLTEYFEELGDEESQTAEELERVSDQFEEMQKEYDQYLEKMRENPEGGYEEQELLEGVSEKQKEIDESIEALKEQFEKLQQEMTGSDRLSEETRRSYEELQQLMQELNDPEFQGALEQLREAMEDMKPDDIEKALDEVEFNEQLYKERIERTKELFKELKMNSDLDKLARQYEEMAERIQKETSLEELMKEMARLKEDLESVEEQLESLTDQSPERHKKELEKLQEESKDALQEMMEQLAEMQKKADREQELGSEGDSDSEQGEQGEQDEQDEQGEQGGQDEQGESQDASEPSEPSESLKQDQQSLGEQMKMQAAKMQQKKGQMGGQQININLMALEHALLRLLDLSEEQERLTLQTNRTRDRSIGFVELAQQQNLIAGQFEAVADSLFKISSEVPGFPNMVNRKKAETARTLQKSLEQISERIQSGAVITSRESLSGINDLASLISSLLEQLMNQSGGGSGGGSMSMEQMLEQMQQMSGDQQQLNRQLQQMVNDMQGNRLSQEQSERLDQLARQQNEIRKQLQDLKQSGALKEGDRMMSELERMIEQMEDSINDLRGGVTDPLMMNRQQDILSRMLDAERAMQQRGEEEKREGQTADDVNQILPPEMTLEQLEREIRSRLQDPDYTTYEEEIQRLIQRYFEMIRKSGGDSLPQ